MGLGPLLKPEYAGESRRLELSTRNPKQILKSSGSTSKPCQTNFKLKCVCGAFYLGTNATLPPPAPRGFEERRPNNFVGTSGTGPKFHAQNELMHGLRRESPRYFAKTRP